MPSYSKNEKLFHLPPEKILLFLLLMSLSVLFVAFCVGYVFTRNQQGAEGVCLPPLFIFNSVILIAGSYTINNANKAYKSDDTAGYQMALTLTMALTIIFMGAQVVGWIYYKDEMLGNSAGNGVNYLYAISGLHFAHITGGLPFLAVFLYNAFNRMREPMTVLIYFSDPIKRMRLQLLTIYWHFLDGLWLFLVLFFLVNMMI
jgi:cytochrome c oxidase subunit III